MKESNRIPEKLQFTKDNFKLLMNGKSINTKGLFVAVLY